MTTTLSSSNAAEYVRCKIEPHSLPRHPEVTALVKQIPVGELARLSKSAGKDTPEGIKARSELIRQSIVNADETPVFTAETVQELITGNQPLYLDLLDVIAKANNKKPIDIEAETDAAEKN